MLLSPEVKRLTVSELGEFYKLHTEIPLAESLTLMQEFKEQHALSTEDAFLAYRLAARIYAAQVK